MKVFPTLWKIAQHEEDIPVWIEDTQAATKVREIEKAVVGQF